MTRPQIRAEERRWRRGDLFALAAAVAVGALFAWILLSIQGLTVDLQTANQARDALAEQVQQLGHKPVAGPPGSRGEPGESVVGPPGPRGEQGDPGPSGPAGPSGPPGKSGKDGADGSDGTAGEPGSVGATGPAGPAGPQGPQGEAGPAGPQGSAGQDGADGKPPAGWTFTYQGVTYTCAPVDGFDPSDPRYQCTACQESTPSPSPSDPQAGLLMLAAVVSRRRSHVGGQTTAAARRPSGRHRAVGAHR